MIMSENYGKFCNSWYPFKFWTLSKIAGKKIHFVNSLVKGSGQAAIHTAKPRLLNRDWSCLCWRSGFPF